MGKIYRRFSALIAGVFVICSTSYAQTGKDCSDPVIISELPYQKSALTTDGFGDDYSNSPCDDNYISGNDYVLTYQPAVSGYVSIQLENADAWTGVHLLDACPDVATQCLASDNQSVAGIRQINDIRLEGGVTYYIVISSFAAPQAVDFDLHVIEGNPPLAGSDCHNPLPINSLPFTDFGQDTDKFGDFHEGTGPCGDENYLNGNEIVYQYIPNANQSVNIEVSNIAGFFAGLQLMEGCVDENPTCVASAFNQVTTADLILENILVNKDKEYYILLSTWENPQTTTFDLRMTANRSCFDPTDFSISNVTQTTAELNWEGAATNWNLQLLPNGASPNVIGSKVLSHPHFLENLTANELYDVYLQANCKAASLMITGVYDGPLSGGNPKGVELYVLNDILDLSEYAIGSANNGEGTDGVEFRFPAVAVEAGTHIYWASDKPLFQQFFGIEADYEDPDALINGDDAVELFKGRDVIDQFGFIDIDGTGSSWEYKDGWAYRRAGQENNNGAFDPTKWTYSGIDNLEGTALNETCDVPFPIGTFNPPPTLASDWVGPFTFNTLPLDPACGGFFYDNGGSVSTYASGVQDTFVICPDQAGFVTEVTFNDFDLEVDNGNCIDGLTIYDGDNTMAPLISPENGTSDNWCWDRDANEGSGDLMGKTIVSKGATGCLTFVFASNETINQTGWTANVQCNAVQDCVGPEELDALNIQQNSAELNWSTPSERAVNAHLVWGLKGITPETGNLVNAIQAPFELTGLEPSTAYHFFVRQDCAAFGESDWVGPFLFVTGCSSSVGDEFADAIQVGEFPYSIIGSTSDCYSNSQGHPSSDAFFELTVADCMNGVKISTCSELSDFDTVIRLYDEDGNEVAFNDDAAVADCGSQLDDFNRLSVLETRVTPGQKYIIMVEGFGPHEGTFEISIDEASIEGIELDAAVATASCAGEPDGSIEVEVIGGTAPYTYNWDNGETTAKLEGLYAGIYIVTVTDDCGYTDIQEVQISEPEPIRLRTELTNPSHLGSSDGSIMLMIDEGKAPFSYSWNNGEQSKNLINLMDGEYCVTVTDAGACTKTTCVTLQSGLTSTRQLDELQLIQLQPNPADNRASLNLEFQEAVDVEITVLNSLGELVWQVEDQQVSKKKYQLDVRSFANGLYFIQVSYKNYVVSQKLVVEH